MIADQIRRPRSDFVGRSLARIRELERQVMQIAPREVPDISVQSGGFPSSPRQFQQVYRPDLIPPGWYEWNGLAWVLVV